MFKKLVLNTSSMAFLFCLVLLVNFPIIQFAMFYPEQPDIYLANRGITHFTDLLNIYLHPMLLSDAIPFFRPSGHFLIYQLLIPFLGWHSIKGLIVVNLFFLTLCGFLIIKMYRLFFPNFVVGGYIAFALYLMHPALILSRLIALHFEFAYVFFTLLSLYCVMLFCQKNDLVFKKINPHWQSVYLSMAALFFYALAVTFKEPAIIIGPLMIGYVGFFAYDASFKKCFHLLLQQREILKILILFSMATLILAVYLTLPWPTLTHPTRSPINMQNLYASAMTLVKLLLGWVTDPAANPNLVLPEMIWRKVIFPKWTQILIWIFWGMFIFTSISLFLHKNKINDVNIIYKKYFLFLCLAVILSLILPVAWGMGLAWHLNLSILFLSFLLGFSVEYVLKIFAIKKSWGYVVGLAIGLASWQVNSANVDRYQNNPNHHYFFSLVRNAILNPPNLQNQLTDQSVLVVEDSKVHNPYLFGNSLYPLFLATNYPELVKVQSFYFLKKDHLYNGQLFRFAYFKPEMQEEIYPFQVNEMNKVADGAIYHWLQHFDHILCVGYDAKGFWHDRTAEFKKNLLKEQANRLLRVNEFLEFSAIQLSGQMLYKSDVMIPDPLMCQLTCDQDQSCAGFTFIHSKIAQNELSQCQFYGAIAAKEQFCGSCNSYIKQV